MYRESQSAHHPTPKKRTTRTYFEIEGCTVTRRHVKELLGEEHFRVVMERAKKRFDANPCSEIRVATSEGILTIQFQLA